jgi:hypothetical protein
MRIPESFFVIYQPKYTVPCVFDLNERGTFPNHPSVTGTWGFRVLADTDLKASVQFAHLVHRPGKDPQTGKAYEWMVEETLIDLDDQLTLDSAAVEQKITDSEICSALMDAFNEWHDNFVPMKKKKVDIEELKQKLGNVVDECKERIRKELVRKNQHWVSSNIPRRIHDFKYGLYNHVKERLYQEYQDNGGEDSEPNLLKKIALFNRVLDNFDHEDLMKPDGTVWRNEDEIWQCWIGFAGSEDEAYRICRTMDAVFKDLELDEVG